MSEQVKYLFQQYIMANGLKIKDCNKILNSDFYHRLQLFNDFTYWSNNRQQIGEKYVEFINYLGVDITPTTAEVGKFIRDSITLPYDNKIITKYKEGLPNKRVIEGTLKVFNGQPIIEEKRQFVREIDTFITQNPYSQKEIIKWQDLHDFGRYNIALGVYGNFIDKDKEEKLYMLKKFKEKINKNDYNMEYDTNGDIYMAAFVSNQNDKVKLLSKTR